MAIKHLLSIAQLSTQDLAYLVNRSVRFASGEGDRIRPLEGKAVGIYFTGTSTRTRLFYYRRAPQRSGDHHHGPRDLQIVTGETIADTARVLAGFL